MSNVNDYSYKAPPNLQSLNTAAAAAPSGYITANADGSVGSIGGIFAGLRVRVLGSSQSEQARATFLRALEMQYPAALIQTLYKETGVNKPGPLMAPELTQVVQKAEQLWAKSGYSDSVIEGDLGQILAIARFTTTAAEFAENAPVVLYYVDRCVERCLSGKATAARVDAMFNHLLGTFTEPQLEEVRSFLNGLVTDKAGPKAMLAQFNRLIEARLDLAPRVRGEGVAEAPMGSAAVASRGRTEAVVVATPVASASTATGVVVTGGSAGGSAAAHPATPVVNTVVPQQNSASAAAAAAPIVTVTVTPSGGGGAGGGGGTPNVKTDG